MVNSSHQQAVIPAPDTVKMVDRLEKLRGHIDPLFIDRVEGMLRMLALMAIGLEGEERRLENPEGFDPNAYRSVGRLMTEIIMSGAPTEEWEVLLLSHGIVPQHMEAYDDDRLSTTNSTGFLDPKYLFSKRMVRPYWEASD